MHPFQLVPSLIVLAQLVVHLPERHEVMGSNPCGHGDRGDLAEIKKKRVVCQFWQFPACFKLKEVENSSQHGNFEHLYFPPDFRNCKRRVARSSNFVPGGVILAKFKCNFAMQEYFSSKAYL